MTATLTVVISTHQRRDLVLRLLDALAAQTLPASDFEVVVVADGCTDGTAQAVRGADVPFEVTVVEQPQRGLSAARNAGAAVATAPVLAFFDDDPVPEPAFLERLLEPFDDGADIVFPFVRVADWMPRVLLAEDMRAWDARVHEAMAAGRVEIDHVHFICTAVSAAGFRRLGGFDEAFTAGGAWGKEDTEFAYRATQAGLRIVPRADIVVDSDCVTDPKVALRRGRQAGANDVRFARAHPELAPQLLAEPIRGSRSVRLVAPLLLRAPWTRALLTPLRAAVIRLVAAGSGGIVLHRLWFLVWSTEWLRGVTGAGGGKLTREALRATR